MMPRTSRAIPAIALAVLTIGLAPVAPPRAAADGPQVEITVLAERADGTPVPALSAGDFELRVDGRPFQGRPGWEHFI